jgi:arsenate reductase
MTKKKVLFVCTHNSARSQLAEGLLRALYPEDYEVYSCGTVVTRVNPNAVEVMNEIGVDISKQYSKDLSKLKDIKFDQVVTVCDNVREACPFFSGAKKYTHYSFKDPSAVLGDPEVILDAFRSTRDEIREWLVKTFG